jgi:predicted permease
LLLAAAGLLVRTFEKLRSMDAGFDHDHVVTFTMDPSLNGYAPPQVISFSNALLERVRALNGVRSAAIATVGLMRGSGMKRTVAPTGQKTSPADFLNSSLNAVSPEYFETMGLHVVAGRGLTAMDKAGSKRMPTVVNEQFVRRFFEGQDPIGKTVGTGANVVVKDNFEIVGVVTDARYRSLREPIPPTMYEPPMPEYASRFILHVRTAIRPESIIGPVREVVRTLDPQLPIVETHTLAEEVEATLWSERLVAALASTFGAIAALLAAIGLYGLLAYSVSQRTREIGIRMALGADAPRVFALISSEAAILVGAGASLGLLTASPTLPLARNLLYGIAPNDFSTQAMSILFVVLIASAAIAIPLLRALRIDPAIALRHD